MVRGGTLVRTGESDVRANPFRTQFDGLQQRNVAVLERDEQRPFSVEKLDDDRFAEGVDGEVERPGAKHVFGVLARKEEVVPLASAIGHRVTAFD